MALMDPVSNKSYRPLRLDSKLWRVMAGINGYEGKERRNISSKYIDRTMVPKYTKSLDRIVTNIESNSFDYLAVKELLYQSNPSLQIAP